MSDPGRSSTRFSDNEIQDEAYEEICRLRKENQILKAHCRKFQEDILKLQVKVKALEEEKRTNFSFVIKYLLQQSEISLQIMPQITERVSDTASSIHGSPGHLINPRNSSQTQESPKAMKSGRPRRAAAPKDLREKSLVTKMRR